MCVYLYCLSYVSIVSNLAVHLVYTVYMICPVYLICLPVLPIPSLLFLFPISTDAIACGMAHIVACLRYLQENFAEQVLGTKPLPCNRRKLLSILSS